MMAQKKVNRQIALETQEYIYKSIDKDNSTITYAQKQKKDVKIVVTKLTKDNKQTQTVSDVEIALETGDTEDAVAIGAIIETYDSMGTDRAIITKMLRESGISEQAINKAYLSYFTKQNLYKVTFHTKPLGITILRDHIRDRLIVAEIDTERNTEAGMKIGSRLYEVQCQRIVGM
eukprot:352107_1